MSKRFNKIVLGALQGFGVATAGALAGLGVATVAVISLYLNNILDDKGPIAAFLIAGASILAGIVIGLGIFIAHKVNHGNEQSQPSHKIQCANCDHYINICDLCRQSVLRTN